jgi:hypothetical protein
MNGQILKFDDSAHRAADAVLPWFVNGTLEGEELAAFERHLRECARCRGEVELQRQLHAACAIHEPAPDATPAYRRLSARIDGGWRIGALVDRLRAFVRPRQAVPRWARWAIAAEFAGIVALAVWVTTPAGDPAALYRTLGAPAARIVGVGAIAVVFAPEVEETELRSIVQAAGARVVDGPTESNAYVLQVPAGHREEALAALRAAPGVVLAQPLTAQFDR